MLEPISRHAHRPGLGRNPAERLRLVGGRNDDIREGKGGWHVVTMPHHAIRRQARVARISCESSSQIALTALVRPRRKSCARAGCCGLSRAAAAIASRWPFQPVMRAGQQDQAGRRSGRRGARLRQRGIAARAAMRRGLNFRCRRRDGW